MLRKMRFEKAIKRYKLLQARRLNMGLKTNVVDATSHRAQDHETDAPRLRRH